MPIFYSGGPYVNFSLTQSLGTRAELVANIITQLAAGGWTYLSGSGTDQTYTCQATAAGILGLQMAVRVYDPGSGNCARVAMRNVSGTKIGQDLFLLPAVGKVWYIIVTPYLLFVMTPGMSGVREFVSVMQLIVPTWLSTTLNCAIATGGAISDADTTLRATWRNNFTLNSSVPAPGRSTHLVSDGLLDMSNVASALTAYGGLAGIIGSSIGAAAYGRRWVDGTLLTIEPYCAFGIANTTDPPYIQGIVPDAVIVDDSMAADTVITLDSHTWIAITGGNGGVALGSNNLGSAPGTFFIRVA